MDVGAFEVDDAAPFNVTLRLTARATGGSTFLGWYGDVGRVVLVCHRDSPFPRRGVCLVIR